MNSGKLIDEGWAYRARAWWTKLGVKELLPAKPSLTTGSNVFNRLADVNNMYISTMHQIVATVRFTVFWKMASPTYAVAHYTKNTTPTDDNPAKYTLLYVSWGGALMSSRGEYTSHVRSYFTLTKHDAWNQASKVIEEHFEEHLQAGSLGFYQQIFFGEDVSVQTRTEFYDFIQTAETLPMHLFACAWFEGYFQIEHGLAPSNLSWDFRAVMHHPADHALYKRIVEMLAEPYYTIVPTGLVSDGAPEDPKKYKLLRKLAQNRNYFFGEPRLYTTIDLIYWQYVPIHGYRYPTHEYCQKMIPLTREESEDRGDITRGVWKETLMSRLCTNLCINHITPGVSLSPGWFYIGGGMGLYESTVIRDRYLFSETGKHIIDHVNDNDGLTVNIMDDPAELAAVFSTLPVAQKPEKLQRNNAAPCPDSSGEMSNVSVVIIYEKITSTLANLPAFSASGSAPRPIVDMFGIYGYTYMMHAVFDYLWTIQAFAENYSSAHTRITVEHLGLLNIYGPTDALEFKKQVVRPQTLMFSRDASYLFPFRGIHGVVIGWGGAIMLNRARAVKAFSHKATPEDLADAYLSRELRKAREIIRRKLAFYNISIPQALNTYENAKVLDILCSLDALDILGVVAGYLTEAVNELSINVPPGTIETLTAAKALAAEEVDRALVRPNTTDAPGRLTAVWNIFAKFYSSYAFDSSCMLQKDPEKHCAISEIYSTLSGVDYEFRENWITIPEEIDTPIPLST